MEKINMRNKNYDFMLNEDIQTKIESSVAFREGAILTPTTTLFLRYELIPNSQYDLNEFNLDDPDSIFANMLCDYEKDMITVYYVPQGINYFGANRKDKEVCFHGYTKKYRIDVNYMRDAPVIYIEYDLDLTNLPMCILKDIKKCIKPLIDKIRLECLDDVKNIYKTIFRVNTLGHVYVIPADIKSSKDYSYFLYYGEKEFKLSPIGLIGNGYTHLSFVDKSKYDLGQFIENIPTMKPSIWEGNYITVTEDMLK